MQTLFVWPNRFVLGMGRRDNMQAIVRQLQPRVKGLLALQLDCAANVRCAAARALIAASVCWVLGSHLIRLAHQVSHR